MDVTPASKETFIASIASFRSAPPHYQPPTAQAPKLIADTLTWDCPIFLYSIKKIYQRKEV